MPANEYYDSSGSPSTSSTGSSQVMRAEFDALEAGFNKLPALSTSANRIWHTNAGAAAATTTSGFTMSAAGLLTVPNGLTVTAGDATISAGNLYVTGSAELTGSVVAKGGGVPGTTDSKIKNLVVGAVPAVVWVDSARTANNKTVEIAFTGGVQSFRFVNDAYNATTTWLSVTGGQAGGITAIASSSGSGAWTHTGTFTVTGTLTGAAATFSGNVTLGDAVGDAHTVNGALSILDDGIGFVLSSSGTRTPGSWVSTVVSSKTGYLYSDSTAAGITTESGSTILNAVYIDSVSGLVAQRINGSNITQVTATGLGVFCTPSFELHVAKSESGSDVSFVLSNTSDTASSSARHIITVGGSSAHDAFTLYQVTGVTDWAHGIDNSDSDKFKISKSTTLGTNDYFVIETSGILYAPVNGLYFGAQDVATSASGFTWSVTDGHLEILADPGNAYAASNIQFKVDATERMRITAAGNIGMVSGDKFYLDGVAATGDTYILESTGNVLEVVVGAVTDFHIASTGLHIGPVTGRGTTNPTRAISIYDGTAPVGTLANGISLYSTAGELRVMDAAGNATLLSPHSQDGRWIHDEVNFDGRVLRVDMEGLLSAVNDAFGWNFVDSSAPVRRVQMSVLEGVPARVEAVETRVTALEAANESLAARVRELEARAA